MKIKISEATPLPLDWLVATAEGYSGWDGECFTRYLDDYPGAFFLEDYQPSTNWAQGGPIIEREKIDLIYHHINETVSAIIWRGKRGNQNPPTIMMTNTQALVAAMRCYVSSKLGDEVEIPKELV